MVENFLKEYAKLIADYPEEIDIQKLELSENFLKLFFLRIKLIQVNLLVKMEK